MKILFRESSRPNIYLQVQLRQFSDHENLAFSLQLRHYDVPVDDNFDGIFSFLLPIIADESRVGAQIFFRKKDSLNSASKGSDPQVNSIQMIDKATALSARCFLEKDCQTSSS